MSGRPDGDFYANWLAESERIQSAVAAAPRVASAKDLKWVRTRQDARAALMIAPETGFPTGGSLLMKAEIPPNWHTGRHVHGEEAIFIESGSGFVVLDGQRFDFRRRTILHIPYRSVHQLVSTGRHHEWEQGDAVHVPPGMLHHQHFNPTDEQTMELRFEFGIRYWFTDQWQGYRTIDKDLKYSPLHDDE